MVIWTGHLNIEEWVLGQRRVTENARHQVSREWIMGQLRGKNTDKEELGQRSVGTRTYKSLHWKRGVNKGILDSKNIKQKSNFSEETRAFIGALALVKTQKWRDVSANFHSSPVIQ